MLQNLVSGVDPGQFKGAWTSLLQQADHMIHDGLMEVLAGERAEDALSYVLAHELAHHESPVFAFCQEGICHDRLGG